MRVNGRLRSLVECCFAFAFVPRPRYPSSQEKAAHLQAAGAIGMVVWNTAAFQPNYLFVMGSDESGRDILFPAVMVDAAAGLFVQTCNDAHIAATPAAAAASSRMVVTLRRASFESGQPISVDPTPVFRSHTEAAAAAATATSSSSSSPSSSSRAQVTFVGGVDHFSYQSMAGWTAEVNYDESANNFQLTLY